MRVLVYDEETTLCAMEIIEIGYTDELEDFEDIDATGEGLYFCGTDAFYYGLPGISRYDCDSIVREIYRLGTCDLTRYGNAK